MGGSHITSRLPDFTPTWELEVRLLIIRGLPESFIFVVDVDSWMLRKEHVGEGHIFRQMPEPLRQFCGNKEEGEYLS